MKKRKKPMSQQQKQVEAYQEECAHRLQAFGESSKKLIAQAMLVA